MEICGLKMSKNYTIKSSNIQKTSNSLLGKTGDVSDPFEQSNLEKKIDMLKQFHTILREQLKSNLAWQIINYNPPKFYVSYKDNKQIILSC